ncbi:discoidin domain-containing protein [Spirosoma panaciterrae]|uniref:discoidin domain-containing protein n=1 Tax=Spirosoma panaciterrae TaxID=496058 RepID=UPI00036946F3|nr:discoidin domain-containing protein [Spirosoma panaciterrae]
MAGIRVNTPTGAGWKYSLDNDTWQDSPVFATQIGGAAFVVGMTYLIYCWHQAANVIAIAPIEFGKPTNEDDLQTVASRGAKTNIMLSLLGGLMLGNIPVTTQDLPVLVIDTATGRVYQKGGTVVLPPEKTIVSIGDLYTLSELQWMMRFDVNNCVDMRGWAFDPSNPSTPPQVVIKRDGVAVGTITCNIERADVRDYLITQGKLPAGSTFATYGWAYIKPSGDQDGQEHTYRAFNPAGSVQATSDVGALNTVRCNAAVNPPPVLVNAQGPVLITQLGTQTIPAPNNEFVDNAGDTGHLLGFRHVSETNTDWPLPLGVSFDETTGIFTITTDCVDQTFMLRRQYVDSANQVANDDFTVVVARNLAYAVDYDVIAGYQAGFYLRCPADWQYKFNNGPNWNNLVALSGGTDSNGFAYGASIGSLSNGATVTLNLKTSNGTQIDLPVNISGTRARANLKTWNDLALSTVYGAVASASTSYDSNYSALRTNDGNVSDFGQPYWASAYVSGTPNEHVDIDFGRTWPIRRVVVHMIPDNYAGRTTPLTNTETFTQNGLTAFRIQVPNGSGGWTTVTGGTVTGNTLTKKTVSFDTVTTQKIRVQIDATAPSQNYAQIMEIEAFSTSTDALP